VKYLLDTDTASYLIRGNKAVMKQALAHVAEWGISAMSVFELRNGVLRSKHEQLHILLEAFLEDAAILPFDEAAASAAAKVQWQLANAGQPIGVIDEFIAGHAISRGLTLVTNNTRHFSRVAELSTLNWAE